MIRFGDSVLATGTLLLGLFLIVQGLRDLYQRAPALFWESTEGVVVSSTSYRLLTGESTNSTYLRYIYEVEARRYEGDRATSALLTSDGGTPSNDDAYAPGKKATVYYNPVAPEESLLMRGGIGRALIMMLCGASSLILCGWALSNIRRSHRRYTTAQAGLSY